MILKYGVILCLYLFSFCSNAQKVEKGYYANGHVKFEGKILNGTKTGMWKFYFPEGNISSFENYKNGLLHGRVEYFDAGGNLISLEHWNEGIQVDSAFYFFFQREH